MDLPYGCFTVAYYAIILFIFMRESVHFLFEWHRLPLLVNFDRQAVLCSVFFLLINHYFIPFAQYHWVIF